MLKIMSYLLYSRGTKALLLGVAVLSPHPLGDGLSLGGALPLTKLSTRVSPPLGRPLSSRRRFLCPDDPLKVVVRFGGRGTEEGHKNV